MEEEACFRCHRVGCRPHICCPKVNNIVIDNDANNKTNIDDLSDSNSDSGKE